MTAVLIYFDLQKNPKQQKTTQNACVLAFARFSQELRRISSVTLIKFRLWERSLGYVFVSVCRSVRAVGTFSISEAAS